MINLKDILKQAATDVGGFPSIFYGNDFETNSREADNAKYPMTQIVPPITGGADISQKTGRARYRWAVFVFFCDIQPENMDATGEQNDEIIRRMQHKAVDYVNVLNRSGQFDYIDKIEFKNLTFKYDSAVSGTIAMFNVKDKTGEIYC